MTPRGHRLFDTAFGRAGIAWSDAGLVAVQLPEATDADTLARLAARSPHGVEDAPAPAPVRDSIALLQRHLETGREDLRSIALDLGAAPPFYQSVYARLREVTPGRTVAYADLARAVGGIGHARAVGTAMARNPLPVVVPCHRVLAAGGGGGFSAHGGLRTKARLLAREGAALPDDLLSFTVRTGTPEFPVDRALVALSKRDAVMRDLIATVGPFTLERSPAASTYEALARSVIYQQLTGKAAATIHGRVTALGADGAFPAPADLARLPDEALRGAGLSGAKVRALQDLAAKTLAGALPALDAMDSLDDDAIVAALSSVRGIGRWSAEMLSMFTLGRPDVLPVGDYGVRNGVRLAYGLRELPSEQELAARGERWRPWRSVASWYLWRAVDLHRGTLAPAS